MQPNLRHAAALLHRGGVIAYATEAVFGLGCDPRNRAAVLRLLRLKQRRWEKGLILIAADLEQLRPYVTEMPAAARNTWPGPCTWLLPAAADAPRWIIGRHPRIAVRVTAHPQAAALCRAAGMALVSTSANLAGGRPARSYAAVTRQFRRRIDYVVPGRVGPRRLPTPIIDAVTGETVRSG